MTSTYLLSDLQSDEGLRLEAYPDPISGGDPWTIGFGHTGPEVHKGLIWSNAQCEGALINDVMKVKNGLNAHIPWWTSLDDLRQDVLVNMAFNMGVEGLLGFPHMLACAHGGDYAGASEQMLDSKWARQLPKRSARLAEQMRTGVHA